MQTNLLNASRPLRSTTSTQLTVTEPLRPVTASRPVRGQSLSRQRSAQCGAFRSTERSGDGCVGRPLANRDGDVLARPLWRHRRYLVLSFGGLWRLRPCARGAVGVRFRRAASSVRVRRAAHDQQCRDRCLPPTIARTDYVIELVASGMSQVAAAARADDQQEQGLSGRSGSAGSPRPCRCRERAHDRLRVVRPEADASDDRWWLWDI